MGDQILMAVITVVTSLIVALASSWFATWYSFRKENEKEKKKRMLSVSNDCLQLLGRLRASPEIAVNSEFFADALRLSNQLYVYGTKETYECMKILVEGLYRSFRECSRELDSLDNEQFQEEALFGEASEFIGERINLKMDMQVYEQKRKEIISKHTLSSGEVRALMIPFLDALKEDLDKNK